MTSRTLQRPGGFVPARGRPARRTGSFATPWLPAARWIAVLLPLALAWPRLRNVVESSMALHMLVEFPVLLASGWHAGRTLFLRGRLRRLRRAVARLDWRGWTSATLATVVASAWMIPAALDAALLSAPVAAAKYASWWVVGLVLAGGWRRADPELKLFLLGNLAWMAGAAGLLYLDAPARLCVSYLIDDQRIAGIGLILTALALGAIAVHAAVGGRRLAPTRPPSG